MKRLLTKVRGLGFALKEAQYAPLLLLAFTACIWLLPSYAKQQPKTMTLILNQQEAEILYQLVDDAAAPGNVRKPLLQKIQVAYMAAFQPPAPQPDTTKKKKN